MKLNSSKPVKQIQQKVNKVSTVKSVVPKEQEVPQKNIIKISIQKDGEIEQKVKDLNAALKTKAQKVELNLTTKFESDKGLQSFCMALFKIGSGINYLRWRIKGAFTDDGQAKAIGDAVGRMSAAYRIEIFLEDTYFADTGAKSLANALKKLQNLQVLRFNMNIMGYKVYKNISDVGINLLKQSIIEMPRCQIFESNQIYNSVKHLPKAQSNYTYDLFLELSEKNKEEKTQSAVNWPVLSDWFITHLKPLSTRLTSINLDNYELSSDYYERKEALYYHAFDIDEESTPISEQKEIFYYNQIKFLYDFPYLTSFEFNIDVKAILQQKPNSKYATETENYNTTLKLLSKSRYVSIHQLIVYKKQILDVITMNPILLIVDLYID